MATAVETMVLGQNSRMGSRQPTDPPEVIDVDLLDDDDIQIVSARRPLLPRPRIRVPESSRVSQTSTPETIDLVDDSDDEGPSTSSGRRVERRRLFSPPPRSNRPFVLVPPVPRVPPQFAGHTSMVHRPPRRPQPPPPPPVRAVDRDFPLNLGRTPPPAAGPSNRQPQAPSMSLQAASRSHHVPSLGLGGAIISDNRARLAAERRAGIPRSQVAEGFVPNIIRRVYPVAARFGALFDSTDHDIDEEEAEYYEYLRVRDRFKKPLAEQEHYKPSYTHPNPPEPGFTSDFAPDESEGASPFPQTSKSEPIVILDDDEKGVESKQEEVKMNTLLVCARCSEPLVLNSGLTGADAFNRRIWALRCGHLIDGKCLSQIGQPAPAIVDRKGKGKAKEEIPYGEDPTHAISHNQGDAALDPPPPEPANIRSRLRSHTHHNGSAATAATVTNGNPSLEDLHGAAVATSSGSPSSRKRKRGPTKASANKKPKVEAEFEWKCPVPSCSNIHASVKINGVWGPEKERVLKKGPLMDSDSKPRGVLAVFA